MAPLIVFLIRDDDMLKMFLDYVSGKNYHTCFILSRNNLKNNFKYSKHQVIVFDFDKFSIDILVKMIVAYTDSIYTHFLIYREPSNNIENDLINLEEKDFLDSNKLIGFSKNYFIFNNLKLQKKEITIDDPFVHFEMMEKALNGEIVNDKYFIIALQELLPEANYKIDCILSNEINEVLLNKNNYNKLEYIVSDEIKDGVKNQIIFTPSLIDDYNFIIRRDDNYNCYII